MSYYSNSEGQDLFDRNMNMFILIGRLIIKAIVYSPFLCGGYVMASLYLDKKDSGIIWLVLIGTFTLLGIALCQQLYALSLLLKKRNNPVWLVPFSVWLWIRCLFPALVIYEPLPRMLAHYIHFPIQPTGLGILISFLFGYNCYYRHRF